MNEDAHAHPVVAELPERLVVDGFRAWMAGYDSGDLRFWESAWNALAAEVGPDRAKPVVLALSRWVRTLRNGAARPIHCYAVACPAFCRDECAVLALISACQRGDERKARAAAYALTGTSGAVDDTVDAAQAFGRLLVDSGCRLAVSPDCAACCLSALVPPASRLN